MTAKTTLILGLGNEILSDDRIGILLVKDLSRIIRDPDIHFATACTGGLEIMELIKDYEVVIIIDSIHTSEGVPGDIYRFKPSDFRETSNLSSLHDVNFLTALSLGKTLEMKLPGDINIIAIEILEDMKFGEKLTPLLEKKYHKILEEVADCVKNIINN